MARPGMNSRGGRLVDHRLAEEVAGVDRGRSRSFTVQCRTAAPAAELLCSFGKEMERTVNVDPDKLQAFIGKMIGHMTGSTLCYSIWLGDELGLYRELAGTGPRSADSVAARTGCNARLVREWLDAQAAGGLVAYDPAADTYELSPEAALALADDGSPVFVARAMNAVGSMFLDMQKVAAAFRGNGALAWGEHHPCLFCGTEWFFRSGYRASLTTQWIPALDGVEPKLRA